jgi:hypothetical protein
LTAYYWISDEEKLSNSFTVYLSSSLSLPNRKYRRSGTSSAPIILELQVLPERTPSMIRTRAVIQPPTPAVNDPARRRLGQVGDESDRENGWIWDPSAVAVAGVSISAVVILSIGMILLKSVMWKLKAKDNPEGVTEMDGGQSE